jgi:hypothetical protein
MDKQTGSNHPCKQRIVQVSVAATKQWNPSTGVSAKSITATTIPKDKLREA